jgi:hypothetical protein
VKTTRKTRGESGLGKNPVPGARKCNGGAASVGSADGARRQQEPKFLLQPSQFRPDGFRIEMARKTRRVSVEGQAFMLVNFHS